MSPLGKTEIECGNKSHKGLLSPCLVPTIAARDNGLKKMSGTSWFGLLFLNLDGKAECTELHDKLDELKKRLNRLGCYEGKLTHVATKSFPLNCNWKVGI